MNNLGLHHSYMKAYAKSAPTAIVTVILYFYETQNTIWRHSGMNQKTTITQNVGHVETPSLLLSSKPPYDSNKLF